MDAPNLPKPDRTDDYYVLTGTLYGEIRGGTRAAQENVAQAILNRVKNHYQKTIAEVCLAHMQFDCWLESDPNYAEILAAPRKEPLVWARCASIAQAAIAGNNPDRIKGACNYYSVYMKKAPYWAHPPSIVTFSDGFHIFVKTA